MSIQLRYTTAAINTQIGLYLAGSGSATILWGDTGSNVVTLTGTATQTLHTYASANTYTVDISGANITQLGNGLTAATGIANLKSVVSFGSVGLISLNGAFRGATGLPTAAGIMPSTLPSTVKNLDYLFYGASSFNDPSINTWDVSGVTSMSSVFYNINPFNVNLNNWNVSNCTNFTAMFQGAQGFNNGAASGTSSTPLNWTFSTTSDITMASMFNYANALNQDLSWNTIRVTDMNTMFNQAIVFNRNIGNWNVSNCTNFSNMFNSAVVFNNGGAALNWYPSNAKNMAGMFFSANAFNQNVSGWDLPNCTNFPDMFRNAISFNNGDTTNISSQPIIWTLNTSGTLIGMGNMFNGANKFNQDISWNTDFVVGMTAMFQGASLFNRNINSWNLIRCTAFNSMFQTASAFNNGGSPGTSTNPLILSIKTSSPYNITFGVMFNGANSFNQDLSFNTIAVSNMAQMFQNNTSFNRNISNLNVSNCLSFALMFSGATAFNNGDPSGNSTKPINWTLTTTSPIAANSMFSGATAFNQDISWNSTRITTFSSMFSGASVFNRNISSWNVINSLNFGGMFSSASAFNNGNARGTSTNPLNWNVGSHSTMLSMFSSATAFNQDISNWLHPICTDFSNMFSIASDFNNGAAAGTSNNPLKWTVKTSAPYNINMFNMFGTANSFNQDLSFSTIAVSTMSSMFGNATAFNRNVSGWNVSNCVNFSLMFNGATSFNNGAPALTTNTAPLTWTLNTAGALKTINMTSMFNNAYSFSQDISSWNIKNVSTMSGIFSANTINVYVSMTKDLFNAMLTKWGVTDPSVNVPKTPFSFGTIKYTSGGSAGLTALRAAPYSWTVTANLVSYSPTSVVSGSSFTFTYNVPNVNPVAGHGYKLVNTNSPSTVLSTFVPIGGNTYTFTNVTIPLYSGYNSLMIIDASVNTIVDVVQINGFYPCLKEGTKILTDKGYVPIEDLRKGDLVKTAINDYKAVYMIGKTEIYNHALPERETHQLYKCSPENYPEVFEDLILTGCHSILVDEFTSEEQRERTREVNGDLYVTRVNYGHIMGGKYRLPACADERAVVYEKEGPFTIYHIALENSNYYHNYGIYANGLLVETCSQRYLNELSHMDSVE